MRPDADAPASGGHAVALARQLTPIVGGDASTVARLMPVFETFSKTVIHVGPTGSGQYGKLPALSRCWRSTWKA